MKTNRGSTGSGRFICRTPRYKQQPFLTGMDFFGPYYVPSRKSTANRRVFLFTCLTTRAVHLEVMPSLDTSSGVMASIDSARATVNPALFGRRMEPTFQVQYGIFCLYQELETHGSNRLRT